MNLSKHFTLAELSFSSTAASKGIANVPDAAATDALKALCTAVLDPVRDALGRPIKVNSGFRGPVLNKLVGGVPDSQHVLGQAVDIQCPGVPVVEVFKTIVRLGLPYDQVIYEAKDSSTKWVHVSHKSGNAPGGNRGEIRVAQFGANGKPTGYPFVTAAQALAMSEPVSRARGAAAEPQHLEMADEPPQETPSKKKAAAKKTAAKKAPAKKAAAKQAAVKAAPVRKVAAKKAPAKKAAAPARRRG